MWHTQAGHLYDESSKSFFVCVFKRAASTSSQDMECEAEPAEKIPRTDKHGNGDDITMDDKDAVKKIAIKKRKDAVDRKKRYRVKINHYSCCML